MSTPVVGEEAQLKPCVHCMLDMKEMPKFISVFDTFFPAYKNICNMKHLSWKYFYGHSSNVQSFKKNKCYLPNLDLVMKIFEPRYEKTGFLHMRKQRRRSASR